MEYRVTNTALAEAKLLEVLSISLHNSGIRNIAMSDNSGSINSKVRVLIARTFHTEKLYAAMGNVRDGIVSMPSVQAIADEVRGKEWQIAHQTLRTKLNEIVRLSSANAIKLALSDLYQKARGLASASEAAMVVSQKSLEEMNSRGENVQVLKLALEVIKLKARFQSYSAVADELEGVIGKSEIQKLASGNTGAGDFADSQNNVVSLKAFANRK